MFKLAVPLLVSVLYWVLGYDMYMTATVNLSDTCYDNEPGDYCITNNHLSFLTEQ